MRNLSQQNQIIVPPQSFLWGINLTYVTLTELLAGMRSGEEELTEKLLSLFTVIDVDNAMGRKAGEYLRRYSRSHNLVWAMH